ncbi:uncharacterized protein A4U43_C03F24380 [Asparagus officinalis]|uniref:Uncharacterized protein n=1 Tax=Asparagus officinalis TaxID=4686 RepID=A0A5P1FHM2_ASPOF|nr:uncharacterized protein A4U43_C03F24380 [Asparagus officinalis]
MTPPIGLEYPFPHRVTKIREEEWDRIRTKYLKLLGKVTSLRAVREVDVEWATETLVSGASDVDRINGELEESNRKARRLNGIFRRGSCSSVGRGQEASSNACKESDGRGACRAHQASEGGLHLQESLAMAQS